MGMIDYNKISPYSSNRPSPEYNQGYKAYYGGISPLNNPYDRYDSQEAYQAFKDWQAGWYDAESNESYQNERPR